MIRLAVTGATGRMGRCALELASRDERFELAAALAAPGCSMNGTTLRIGDRDVRIAERLECECDVLIDFSLPEGTMAWLDVCERREIPMVIGVTGHDDRQLAQIREAAHRIPIVLAANFSVGMNAVLGVLSQLARAIGAGYDIEIVETHHRHKADAPSGTALTIVEELRRALDQFRDREGAEQNAASPLVGGAPVVFGRHGKTGDRPAGQIGVHAVRMGDVVGQHEIHFSGCGETIAIRHTAHSRETFAAGALRAAAWIVSQGAGFYAMRDVLNADEQRENRE
jgi:4-hydroxy-tetrahydrodipicolinate reductase